MANKNWSKIDFIYQKMNSFWLAVFLYELLVISKWGEGEKTTEIYRFLPALNRKFYLRHMRNCKRISKNGWKGSNMCSFFLMKICLWTWFCRQFDRQECVQINSWRKNLDKNELSSLSKGKLIQIYRMSAAAQNIAIKKKSCTMFENELA